MDSQNLSLYITTEHECGYYDDRQSANLIPDPQVEIDARLYSLLISKGFRRSGDFVYRPHCKECAACVPCRIGVKNFKPSRNQAKNLAAFYWTIGIAACLLNLDSTASCYVLQ